MTSRSADPGCAYCGLPLPSAWWRRSRPREAESEPLYCCLGCRLAAEITQQRGEQGDARWTLTRLGLAVFFTMNVMVFTMALWTYEFYPAGSADDSRFSQLLGELFRYLGLLFSLPVLMLLGWPLADNAWRNLRAGLLNTDVLLVTGVAAAYVYSAVSVFRGAGHVYFEVGCMVLVFVTLGRWLEATGKLQASAALDALQKLLPDEVRVLRDGTEQRVPLVEVAVGDRVRVLPGERIPVDGRLQRSAAAVDEQVVTGEYQPAIKEPGDPLYAGTLNLDADLVVEATATAGEGSLWRLIEMITEARHQKGHYERLADRVARWFIPAVAAIASATFALHLNYHGFEEGLLAALAVLLIACPCALGIATPMAVWAALGTASRAQVLFRNGEALERLAAVRAIRFDKTGTLATATPTVDRFVADPDTDRQSILERAAIAAAASTHGFSRAIDEWIGERPSSGNATTRTLPGRGVLAMLDEEPPVMVLLGSWRWMDEAGQEVPDALRDAVDAALAAGEPFSCLAWGGRLRGVFVFREQLRPEAAAAVRQCAELPCDVGVLTGDHATRAKRLAETLGIACAAELLPGDKVAAIRAAHDTFGSVAMVGDGINDAPALAASDVGIAMGCGADVSRESAAVCLMSNDLLRLPWAVRFARRAVRTIRLNLFWAFAYNTLGIGIAAVGWLNPVLAALAMVVSSLLVVSNSLALARAWPDRSMANHGDYAARSADAATAAGKFNALDTAS